MRALAVRSFGEAAEVQDLPAPAADGAFLIRVTCAGVNPIDSKLLEKLTATSPYPVIAGIDFAGVAERVPAGQREIHPGDRVFGMARTHGSYAEYTAVLPGATGEPVARIPDSVTDEQAAALPVPSIAALRSVQLLGVTTGRRLVVMGANGAVGGYAVQMARARGAHVIATVRGDPDESRRLGAEEVYDIKTVEAIHAICSAHPGGVDSILDLVNGADAIRRDAEILRPGGSLVSTLQAADERWFAGHQIKAYNISGPANPLASRQGLNEVARMMADGVLAARVRCRAELDGAAQMLDQLRHGRLHGKAVIRV